MPQLGSDKLHQLPGAPTNAPRRREVDLAFGRYEKFGTMVKVQERELPDELICAIEQDYPKRLIWKRALLS